MNTVHINPDTQYPIAFAKGKQMFLLVITAVPIQYDDHNSKRQTVYRYHCINHDGETLYWPLHTLRFIGEESNLFNFIKKS